MDSEAGIKSTGLVDYRRERTPADRLFNLALTVLANINGGGMLKPKKNNKLMEKLNPPVDKTMTYIDSRIDCS